MRGRDVVELLILAALWGGSFLFMRVAAPEFGPLPLVAVRVGIAAALLVPLLALRDGLPVLRQRAGSIYLVGLLNSALPFCGFAFAALSVTAGFSAFLNASTPIWGALIAFLWLGERLSRERVFGLVLGVAGVAVLVAGNVSFKPGGSGWAVVAVLAAALMYGIAANFTKRYLTGVNPLALAAGSQLAGALTMVPVAIATWPSTPISLKAWAAAIALGVACTGIAYILFFRLIASVGPARAITVTFLVPVFATLWGGLFLGEAISGRMLAGGAIILLGTALATGIVKRREAVPVAAGELKP